MIYKLLIILALFNLANMNSSDAQTSGKPTDTVIVNFVYQATLFGLQQVNSAKLALKRSNDPRIKSSAAATIKLYKGINERLSELVAKNRYQVPAYIDQSVAPAPALSNSSDEDFDPKYISMMLKDDKRMVELFARAAVIFTDPDLKSFIRQAFPVLQSQRAAVTLLSKEKQHK